MDRVVLHLEHGVGRVKAWQCAPPESYRCRTISIGTLAGGRWWANHTGVHGGAFLCRDRAHAQEVADGWMDGGEWWEVPAEFGPDGQPTEPGWVRRGGSWFPA
jgi:hypothetical protein